MGAMEKLTSLFVEFLYIAREKAINIIAAGDASLDKGQVYYAQIKATIAGSGSLILLGVTDAGSHIHMGPRNMTAYSIGGEAIDVTSFLYEGTDYTGGTAVPSMNLSRPLELGDSEFTITHTATGSSKGTDIKKGSRIVASAGVPVAGSLISKSSPSPVEYGMIDDESYLLEVENNTVNPVDIVIDWQWREL